MSTLLASPSLQAAKLQTGVGSSGGGRGAEQPSLPAQPQVWEGADGNLQGGNVRRRPGAGGEDPGAGGGQPHGCPAAAVAGLAAPGEVQPCPLSPAREAGGARRGAGGGRQDAVGGGAGAWEAGSRAGLGWRCEQAERSPGQGQTGKRQGADEIQEEEEVDGDEAAPPAGSGGGGGGGEGRLAGSREAWAFSCASASTCTRATSTSTSSSSCCCSSGGSSALVVLRLDSELSPCGELCSSLDTTHRNSAWSSLP